MKQMKEDATAHKKWKQQKDKEVLQLQQKVGNRKPLYALWTFRPFILDKYIGHLRSVWCFFFFSFLFYF